MSTIRIHLWGDWSASSATYVVAVTLAGTTVLTGSTAAVTSVSGSRTWELEGHINCQAIGSGTSGAVRGVGHVSFAALDTTTPMIATLTKAGAANASGPTLLDTTIAIPIDVLFTPSINGAGFRVYGGNIWIDG
jgi:hypothetical protein